MAQQQSPASTASSRPNLPEPSRSDRDAAEKIYLAGAKELRDGQMAQAEKDFALAVQRNPTRPEYVQALLLAREHRVTNLLHDAAKVRDTDPAAADAFTEQARQIDPQNPAVTQHAAPHALRPVRSERFAGNITLQNNDSRHSYHRRADLRVLAQEVARDYGLRAVLDPEMQTQQFRIDVDDANFAEAMRVLNLATDTMFVPLDEHTILLAKDSASSRQRYERMVEVTYFLPGYAADQLKDFVSIAQTILNIPKVSVDGAQSAIVVRGPADLADAAGLIFTDLLNGSSDVVLDVKVYSIDHQQVRNVGVVLPTSFTGYNVATQAQNIISSNSSLVQQLISSGVLPSGASNVEIAAYLVFVAGLGGSSSLANTFLTFGGGQTLTGVSAATTFALNLALSRSDARMLEDVQLRAEDRKDAIFKTGLRYPIQTSLYSDIATSTASSTASVNGVSLSSLLSQYLGSSSLSSSAVVPQVQYEDLGLTLTANPKIQRTGDVATHLEVKITALAGSSLNGIPVLASRLFSSDLTVHDGETVMMISETDRSETAAVSGIPGLSELPGFQSTTNKNSSLTTSELVVLVTPHIVRQGHPSAKGPYIALEPRPDSD